MSRSPKPKPDAEPAALTFEQALEQVESIIERIERGEIGLEESLAEYERGVKLIQHCRRIHKDAVQRVDDLTRRLMAEADQADAPDEDESPEP